MAIRIDSLGIAVAQMRPHPGSVRDNLKDMLAFIAQARKEGAQIIVFPELCVSGYVLGDRWEHDSFIREIEAANDTIRRASAGLAVVWGSIKADWGAIGEDGRVRKYNAAFIAADRKWVSNGVLVGWVPKTNLPKYRIFDDARHFYPGDKLAAWWNIPLDMLLRPFVVSLGGAEIRLGLTVCEDLWEDEYSAKLSQIYRQHHANLLIDISASPWTVGKWQARERMLTKRVRDSGIPILYVNAVGLENNTKNLIWFDGDSTLVDASGAFVWRAPQHVEGLFRVGTDVSGTSYRPPSELEEIHDVVVHAMSAFIGRFNRVVIGLSGGIDSAVSAALLVESLGREKVLALNMPTHFNSETTKGLAKQCAENLGIEYRVVPIQGLADATVSAIMSAGFPRPEGLSYENLQARIRGASIQALIAQMQNGVFVCNGNKTEIALNYFTLYGDGAGVAAFLGDLWKGQVYSLARFINTRAGRTVIPQGIIDLIPSAELSAEQNVDEGKGDPIFYPYHDQLLKSFTEKRWDPTLILERMLAGDLEEALGCAPGTIRRYFSDRATFVANLEWAWKRYNMEFKRGQTPPVLIASRRAFGFDRRDPISDGYFTLKYDELKQQYLSASTDI